MYKEWPLNSPATWMQDNNASKVWNLLNLLQLHLPLYICSSSWYFNNYLTPRCFRQCDWLTELKNYLEMMDALNTCNVVDTRLWRQCCFVDLLCFCVRVCVRNKLQRCWIIPSSGILRWVRWFETDVSGLPIGPIFKGQAILLLW